MRQREQAREVPVVRAPGEYFDDDLR